MDNYVQAVRGTISGGGCNASRGAFIGACFAAHEGPKSIPEEWIKKTGRGEEVLKLSKQLVALRSTSSL